MKYEDRSDKVMRVNPIQPTIPFLMRFRGSTTTQPDGTKKPPIPTKDGDFKKVMHEVAQGKKEVAFKGFYPPSAHLSARVPDNVRRFPGDPIERRRLNFIV